MVLTVQPNNLAHSVALYLAVFGRVVRSPIILLICSNYCNFINSANVAHLVTSVR